MGSKHWFNFLKGRKEKEKKIKESYDIAVLQKIASKKMNILSYYIHDVRHCVCLNLWGFIL